VRDDPVRLFFGTKSTGHASQKTGEKPEQMALWWVNNGVLTNLLRCRPAMITIVGYVNLT
jgi:hypothetical protein